MARLTKATLFEAMLRLLPPLCFTAALLCSCGTPDAASSAAPDTETAAASQLPDRLDIHGHRGARGLLPENTIPGFVLALREGADVLEMDLCISADGQVIVSHEPWMSHNICRKPDGNDIRETEEQSFNLHALTAGQIAEFDCGMRPHPDFPEQRHLPAHKPTLGEVVHVIETVPLLDGAPVRYNLELKHRADWEPTFCPQAAAFARMVIAEVNRLGIAERTILQSFSAPMLEAIHAQAPDMATAWLVNTAGTADEQLAKLSFQPEVYSPKWTLLDAETVHDLQSRGIQVIPWTVNEGADLFAMMQMGVDGIITDHPDRLYDMR